LLSLAIFGITQLLSPTPLDSLAIQGSTGSDSQRNVLSIDADKSSAIQKHTYLVCSIDDDPDELNTYGIYNPTDLAVTIRNLRRLGIRHLFLGTHLHWQDADPLENKVLKNQLEKLDSCIISVPLRRTLNGIELPSYLAATAIPLSHTEGNLRPIPQVNNYSLPPTFTIPSNAQVGFSQLETEPPSEKIPLLAKWGDHLICSSLVLEKAHQLGLKPRDLHVIAGQQIQFGDTGFSLKIDSYGYFTPTTHPKSSKPDLISASILSAKKSPIATTAAILTAAGKKADTYRAIDAPKRKLTQLILSTSQSHQPVHWLITLATLILLACLLTKIQQLTNRKRNICLLGLGISIFLIAFLIATYSHYYLPITSYLALIISLPIFHLLTKTKSTTQSVFPISDIRALPETFKKRTYSSPQSSPTTKSPKKSPRKKKKKSSKRKRSKK